MVEGRIEKSGPPKIFLNEMQELGKYYQLRKKSKLIRKRAIFLD